MADPRPMSINTPTVNIVGSSSSQSVAYGTGGTNAESVVVTVVGTGTAFIKSGISGLTVDATGFPVLGNTAQTFTKAIGDTTAYAIVPSGTATIYFSCGEGV